VVGLVKQTGMLTGQRSTGRYGGDNVHVMVGGPVPTVWPTPHTHSNTGSNIHHSYQQAYMMIAGEFF